jgi:hypothetical protein
MILKPEPVSIVSYLEGSTRRIYVFALGEDGHLYVNWWDGARWRWADQGKPGIAMTGQATAGVSAITYREGGKQRIYAFVPYGNLYVNYWDGNGWHWADQGRPSSQDVLVTRPSAVTYRQDNQQRIYCFVSTNSTLFVNYWDGKGWHWGNQGAPPVESSGGAGSPEAITYSEGGVQRLYIFVTNSPASLAKGRLYVNWWDGNTWRWADQGRPSAPFQAIEPMGPLSGITYTENGQRRIYLFARGGLVSPGHLYVNYWNGTSWQWADQGTPASVSEVSYPATVTYRDESGKQRIYTFVNAGRLYVNWWDGSKWNWADQGTPPGGSWHTETMRAITYHDGIHQRIYAFMVGQDGHLWAHYWDGAGWHWGDQGMPQTSLAAA